MEVVVSKSNRILVTGNQRYIGRDWGAYLRRSVSDALGLVTVELNPDAIPDKRSYRVDFGRFRRLTPEFVPVTSLPEAVKSLASWLRSVGFNQTEFREGECIGLMVPARLLERGAIDSQLRWSESSQ